MVTAPTREKEERKGLTRSERERTILPNVDLYESEDSFLLEVELPGVPEESIDIVVDGGVLTISAEAAAPPFDDYQLVYMEFALSKYQRQFSISETLDTDSIEADFRNGILRLTLPKHAERRPRKIPVRAL